MKNAFEVKNPDFELRGKNLEINTFKISNKTKGDKSLIFYNLISKQ